jgi:hypothetical protein
MKPACAAGWKPAAGHRNGCAGWLFSVHAAPVFSCSPLQIRTLHADVLSTWLYHIPIFTKRDHLLHFAQRVAEFGRVFQLLEVVFICAVVNVHFGLEIFSTLLASLPIAGVFFCVMVAAQGVAVVIAVAAIAGIREQLVFMLVVANPLPAALGLGQVFGFAAQAAARG